MWQKAMVEIEDLWIWATVLVEITGILQDANKQQALCKTKVNTRTKVTGILQDGINRDYAG